MKYEHAHRAHPETGYRPENYLPQPFPSVRHHRSGKTRTVNSQEEHDELVAGDPDWAESPAAFADPAAPAEPAPPADPAEPANDAPTPAKAKEPKAPRKR